MITEDFVSFETAKLLKEKGFEVDRITMLIGSDNKPFLSGNSGYEYLLKLNHEVYPAPTLQMAMKWLREVYHIGVFPSTYCISFNNQVTYPYGTCIINLETHEIMLDDCMARDTYNEACEAAIKYCLENLI